MASLSNYRYLVIEPGIANKLSKFGIKDVYGIAYLFGYFSIQTFFQGVLLNHKKRKERMIYYEIF